MHMKKVVSKFTVLVVILLGWLSPIMATTPAQKIDTSDITFDRLLKSRNLVAAQNPELNSFIQRTIREMTKTKFLGNLYEVFKQDPTKQIGDIKLADAFASIDKCEVLQNAIGVPMVADSNRSSDFYALNRNFGILNDELLAAKAPQGVVMIYIHVCLGADGWNDEYYEKTLALLSANEFMGQMVLAANDAVDDRLRAISPEKLLSNKGSSLRKEMPTKIDPTKELKDKDLKKEPSKVIIKGKDPGSYTGVGGGGDIWSVMIKLELVKDTLIVHKYKELDPLCASRWQDPNVFLDDVLNIKIESDAGVPSTGSYDSKTDIYWVWRTPFPLRPEIIESQGTLLLFSICKNIAEKSR